MTSFSNLGLKKEILKALHDLGFEQPTEIQSIAIPVVIETSNDLLALAQTGTGKTAAFGLPSIHLTHDDPGHIQTLILCPTRELCLQIQRDLEKFSKYLPQVSISAIYGGSSYDKQLKELRANPRIVVATPGRLTDLANRGKLDLSRVETVVLDEADEMLNMGFEEDVKWVLDQITQKPRVLLFSATMPQNLRKIVKKYMHEPVELNAGKVNSANANITHKYAVVAARDKFEALTRMIALEGSDLYAIVFCTTRQETQDIAEKLYKKGFLAESIHGDLSQQQREKVMAKFRNKQVRILVATDVAARGIDVTGITHVIHFHLPDDPENYTHRSGRTARAGALGISFSLLHSREVSRMRELSHKTGISFEKIRIPSSAEIKMARIAQWRDELAAMEMPEISHEIKELVSPLLDVKKEMLLYKLLYKELGFLMDEVDHETDINLEEGKSGRSEKGESMRIFVSVGKKDGFKFDTFKDFVADLADVNPSKLYVDVMDAYSFVETRDAAVAARVVDALNATSYRNRNIKAEFSDKKPPRKSSGNYRKDDRYGKKSSYQGNNDRNAQGGRNSQGGGGKKSYGDRNQRKDSGNSGGGGGKKGKKSYGY